MVVLVLVGLMNINRDRRWRRVERHRTPHARLGALLPCTNAGGGHPGVVDRCARPRWAVQDPSFAAFGPGLNETGRVNARHLPKYASLTPDSEMSATSALGN